MHYEINIALNGRHFFATDKRSIQDSPTLMQVAKVLNEKFPENEGYTLSASYYPDYGYSRNREQLMEVVATKDAAKLYDLFGQKNP